MAAFASAYGTFVQIAPASPPPEDGGNGGGGGGWGCVTGASGMSGSGGSLITSSSSPPPQLQGNTVALPIHYRCLLLVDDAAAAGAGIVGVRLGWDRARLLRVTAVLSESVMGVCQVARGDIVTHVNGESVAGMEADGGAGGLLLRAQKQKQRRAVVELRLIRARSLPPLAQDEEEEEEEEARTVVAAYARLLQGPMLLYEAHARDTLQGIAARFQTTAHAIRADNREVFPPGESVPPAVQPGLLLRIRNTEYAVVAAGVGDGGGVSPPWATPERGSRSTAAAVAGRAGAAAAGAGGGGGGTLVQRRCYHLVTGGETLEGIARRYGVASVMDIRRWNRGLFPVGEARPAVPGDRLLLFVCSSHGCMVEEGTEVGDGKTTKQQGGKRRGGGGGSRSAPIAIATAADGGGGSSRATPSPE